MREKVVFAWSSGKDCARALHELMQLPGHEVIGLMATVTEGYDRISMHGVRIALVEQQARAIDLHLQRVYIPKESSNERYEDAMKTALLGYKAEGVTTVAFGDLFLEDLKTYREGKLAGVGMKALFPLWKRDTGDLADSFIQQGFRAIITSVDSQMLDGSFSGRFFDAQFLADLPASIDPCGENGEFHSFVFDGPLFNSPICFEKGEVVVRESRFHFCELIPTDCILH